MQVASLKTALALEKHQASLSFWRRFPFWEEIYFFLILLFSVSNAKGTLNCAFVTEEVSFHFLYLQLGFNCSPMSDQTSVSSFALQQWEEGRILLTIMALQKHGGRTGEQNETEYILTFPSCKTSFSKRCLNCQLALLISARRTVRVVLTGN